jgi:hypothetical protein
VSGGRADRIQAGTQTSNGGIRGADRIPDGATPLRSGPALPDQIPMKLWEGTLADAEALLISPTIWEYDGEKSIYATWVEKQRELDSSLINAQKVQEKLRTLDFAPIVLGDVENFQGEVQAGWKILRGLLAIPTPIEDLVKTPHDRPIGIFQAQGSSMASLPHVVVVLTRQIIEKALSGSAALTFIPKLQSGEEVTGVILAPMKPGVLAIVLQDNVPTLNLPLIDFRRACYVMTIQVERK